MISEIFYMNDKNANHSIFYKELYIILSTSISYKNNKCLFHINVLSLHIIIEPVLILQQ